MSLDRFPSKFCLSFFPKNLRFLRCDWLVRTRLIAAQLLQSAWSILRRRRILYTYALIDAVHRQPYARPILLSRLPSFHFAGVSLLSIQQLRRPDCHRGMKRVHVQNYIIFSFFINSIPGSSFSLILRGEENMLLLQNSADTHHVWRTASFQKVSYSSLQFREFFLVSNLTNWTIIHLAFDIWRGHINKIITKLSQTVGVIGKSKRFHEWAWTVAIV